MRAPASAWSMSHIAVRVRHSKILSADALRRCVIASLRAGQARALALAANSVSEILPSVPPMPQIGYPDLVASAWVALYVPAKSPAAVIERLRTELDALLASSAFAERMKQVGIEVNRMRPDEFAAFAQQERSRWAKLIESLDLKIE